MVSWPDRTDLFERPTAFHRRFASGRAAVDQMKAMPVDDPLFKGKVRIDGRMVHDMYLFQVKAPAESRHPWDYFNLIATVSGADAFGTPAQSNCPLDKAELPAKSGGSR